MKTIEINLYKFDELSEDAKENAIQNNFDINIDYEWWNYIYDEAKNIGLKLPDYDLKRNLYTTGELIENGFDVAVKITHKHGKMCETYKIAKKFLSDYDEMFKKYEDTKRPGYVSEENERGFDSDLDELEKEFLKNLLSNYAEMLQNEYMYNISDDAISETLIANDYDFTEDGEIY